MLRPLSMPAALLALTATLGCGGSPLSPLAQRMAGCPGGALGAGPPTTGRYAYGACDAQGRLLLLGHLTVTISGAGAVSGTWEIDWAPGADRSVEVGPQVGSGNLTGRLDGTQLWVDLNPGWADNNVFLAGTWRAEGGGGTWDHSTLTGPRASGTFSLRR